MTQVEAARNSTPAAWDEFGMGYYTPVTPDRENDS